MSGPVDQQLEAFNDRDLDRFMDAFASDAEVEDGEGTPIMSGAEEMKPFYAAMFADSPDLHCDVVNRISVGDWVIEEEHVVGVQAEGFPEEFRAAVAYKVEGGKITRVRVFM